MRILLTFGLICIAALGLHAQQERQYTQFMYNKLTYNPGYAGNLSVPTITAIYRNQWMGLSGAPVSQLASYHQNAMSDRVGFGLSLSHSSIGINRRVTADGAYAYRFKIKTGVLAVGLQASIRYFNQNWADERLSGAQPVSGDAALPGVNKTKVVPNFGAGVFYHAENFYIGASVPRLIGNNIDFSEVGGEISRELKHGFLMAGYTFDLNGGIELTPQVLMKMTQNAPFDADVNVTAEWNNRFSAGLTYRTGSGNSVAGESLDIIGGFQLNTQLFFALSYDIGLTRLRQYNNGSLEVVARYYLRPVENVVDEKNPRYF